MFFSEFEPLNHLYTLQNIILLILLGLVTDEDGNPIEAANIVIEGINHNVSTTSRGEYWRLLLPGTYTVYAAAWE